MTPKILKEETEPLLSSKKQFYSRFMHSFYQHLKFHEKNYILKKKKEKKIMFLPKTTSGSDSKHRMEYIESISFSCLKFYDRVIFHKHLLTYAITTFCLFFTCVWSRCSILFQKMFDSTSYNTSENTESWTFLSLARKEFRNSSFQRVMFSDWMILMCFYVSGRHGERSGDEETGSVWFSGQWGDLY